MTTLKRILYAEDEPDIQAVARIALEMLGGFELRVCNNGQEALDALNDFAPDLILLDVMMPRMDGPTTLDHIKRHPSAAGVPVVFMTAKVQGSEVEAYLDKGAIGVIAKPFDPMTLVQQLKDLWAQCHERPDQR
ncbi:response regulator [Salinispirillum sp. LH 10-3-1]|uniref:Response regulator n=1 Tax=Salinispirillum sp. LH 10-3-1 TaxID=2952525 RepID=A0AB38YDW8_9GAMM